jgi:hypothetical protein
MVGALRSAGSTVNTSVIDAMPFNWICPSLLSRLLFTAAAVPGPTQMSESNSLFAVSSRAATITASPCAV